MYNLPDDEGRFGKYGGRFVPETLIHALTELEQNYNKLKSNSAFIAELNRLHKKYTGRPTPLIFAERLTNHFDKAKIYLKREDLCHTGAHKINNAIGQALVAKALDKKRIIAETGAGQHGVAVATVCALFGLECVIYMGEVDIERQEPNVFRMNLLGAVVKPVKSGSRTLKDATNEAIRDWVANINSTHYIIGSVVGPHPYPMIVRDFQSIIGTETKWQVLEAKSRLPDYIVACVGGGSNAAGIFLPFINDKIKLIGVEAAGKGLNTQEHAATLSLGKDGIFHGMKSYLIQDENGQVSEVHSISAGLDYPGVGPEHSNFKDTLLVEYNSLSDAEAIEGVKLLSKLEGIIPALESAHAIGYLTKLMPETKRNEIVIVNVSGRGDKDLNSIQKYLDGK